MLEDWIDHRWELIAASITPAGGLVTHDAHTPTPPCLLPFHSLFDPFQLGCGVKADHERLRLKQPPRLQSARPIANSGRAFNASLLGFFCFYTTNGCGEIRHSRLTEDADAHGEGQPGSLVTRHRLVEVGTRPNCSRKHTFSVFLFAGSV